MKMKKMTVLLFAAVLCFCLFSCTGRTVGAASAGASAGMTEKDFTVYDGEKNYITLDSPYEVFAIDAMEEADSSYVGEIYSGELVYKVYCHNYTDFDLYTSNMNYNFKNRGFDNYYITQITLKTSMFKTYRGIAVGSGVEDLMNAYGFGEEVIEDGNTNASYTFNDMKLQFTIDENKRIQRIILLCCEI